MTISVQTTVRIVIVNRSYKVETLIYSDDIRRLIIGERKNRILCGVWCCTVPANNFQQTRTERYNIEAR